MEYPLGPSSTRTHVGGAKPGPRRRTGWDVAAGASALLLVLAAPVLTWWRVGDLSEIRRPKAVAADYMVQPPNIGDELADRIGITAGVLVGISVVALLAVTGSGAADRRWWLVGGPLVLIGVFGGWGYRTMTAAVVGANFGGGFVMVAAPIVVGTLLGVSVRNAVRMVARWRDWEQGSVARTPSRTAPRSSGDPRGG